MNKQINKKDIYQFFKKYGYILVLSVTLLVTAIVMALIVTNTPPTEQTNTGTVTFTSPVLNGTVAKGYSDTALQYNSTLKQWEAHKAITFTVADGTDVFAVLDGTVKDIYNNYLQGTVVVVEHAGSLTSVYGSLASTVNVRVGDIVKKGDVIGKASATANAELNLGTHLRYELRNNGTVIDPSTYLNLENK